MGDLVCDGIKKMGTSSHIVMPAQAGIHCPAGTNNTDTPASQRGTWAATAWPEGGIKKQARRWRTIYYLCSIVYALKNGVLPRFFIEYRR